MADLLSEDEARRKVEAHLARMQVDWELVIVAVRDFPVGWVFFYDSKIHHETRSISGALLAMRRSSSTAPDGTLHVTGIGRPIEEYIERYMARDPSDERSWHP